MGLNNLLACSFESNYIIEQFDNGNLIRMLMGFTWFPIGFYHLQYENFFNDVCVTYLPVVVASGSI